MYPYIFSEISALFERKVVSNKEDIPVSPIILGNIWPIPDAESLTWLMQLPPDTQENPAKRELPS